jgi:endonuclease YncB( thermonuclease family)
MKTFLTLFILTLSNVTYSQKVNLYQYSAVVNHIRDGDTFEALVSVGFDTYVNVTIRMASIDAPEMKGKDSTAAKRSKAYLSRLILNKTIYFNSKQYDKYKRSIAEVYLSKTDTVSVNRILVNKGYAVAKKY